MSKVTHKTITPEHIKAARALLRWTAADLAERADVGAATVRRFESGRAIQETSKKALFDTLEGAGAWFKNGGKPSVGLNNIEARKA